MSDKLVQYYNSNSGGKSTRGDSSNQTWSRTTIKKYENAEFKQQYPSLVIPTNIYNVVHVNKHITLEEIQLLIEHASECTQFTIDTESEKSNRELALIQIQSIPKTLPLVVMLIELTHLPSSKSNTYEKLKKLFKLIFRFENQLFSWGNLKLELDPAKKYDLFNGPINAAMINIQDYFSDWYNWALSHEEASCQEHHYHNDDVHATQNNPVQKCNRHMKSPYFGNEKWSLQKALIYSARLFIDKSITVNNWSIMLKSNEANVQDARREQMILYAIMDCLATTYLIRPVLEYWTFQQVEQVNIVDIFKSFKLRQLPTLSVPKKKNKIKKNINLNKIFGNFDDDDLQSISEDEIYLHQLIEPIEEQIKNGGKEIEEFKSIEEIKPTELDELELFEDNVLEEIADPVKKNEKKKKRKHRDRPIHVKQRRNKKRNNIHKSRRYQYYITRPIYYKFNESSARIILKQHHFKCVHVKIVNGLLIIGVKNKEIEQKYQKQIPEDMFDREKYQIHRYHQYHHQHHRKQQHK